MKTLQIVWIFIAFLLVSSTSALAQKSNTKHVELKSFTFSKKAFQIYKQSKLKPAALKVSSKGVVSPARGYKMAVTSDKKYVIVVGKGDAFIPTSRIDMRPGKDGSYWCVCSGYPDDCLWTNSICKGSCGCGIVFEPDEVGGIVDYATPGGGYF